MSDPKQLADENERLRMQVAALAEERDTLRRAYLEQLAQAEPGFTAEQFAAGVSNGPWFDEFLKRIEAGDPSAADAIPTK